MSDTQRFPRPFRVLAGFIFVLSLALFILSWHWRPLHWSPTLAVSFALLAAGAMLSENYALYLERYHISLTFPLTVAAIVIAGPSGAAIIAALSAITVMDIRTKTAPSAMLFNLGELVSVTVAAGWAYLYLYGRMRLASAPAMGQPLGGGDFPGILVPLLSVALICTFGNVAMTAIALTTIERQPLRSSLAGLAWLIPSQFALSFVGYLIAQVLAINPIALPLFIAPLLLARQLYQRYAALKEAYADTVRSLVGALEAKDPYTRGHSVRVAGYALELGEAAGLDSRSLERLEYAALLHDLGKLAVPSRLLTKPDVLTDDEMDSVRRHASRGAEMVSKIPPLRDLAELVGNHHEWFNGGGYPLRTAAPEIPQLALIMSVADSYDAMTTTRAYRSALTHDQAIGELIRGAGSQFDPDLVRSFIEGRVGCEKTADATAQPALAAIPLPVQGEGQ